MTGKITKLVVSLLAISLLKQPCKAPFDTTSTVVGLYQFIEMMILRMITDPNTTDETLLAVNKMNQDVQYQLSEILKSLKDLPSRLNRIPITWEGTRSFDLTSYILPQDEVVTAFALKPSKSDPKRISLELEACKFDFRTRKVMHNNCYYTFENPAIRNSPKTQLKLNDADVPIRSIKPNAPISNGDQYVTLNTTNMEKDAGQTTIPSIDTQKVAPTPPMPLSGAGLYLRGQEGFGGFLAIKLYTYNITDYIEEEAHLPDWPRTP